MSIVVVSQHAMDSFNEKVELFQIVQESVLVNGADLINIEYSRRRHGYAFIWEDGYYLVVEYSRDEDEVGCDIRVTSFVFKDEAYRYLNLPVDVPVDVECSGPMEDI